MEMKKTQIMNGFIVISLLVLAVWACVSLALGSAKEFDHLRGTCCDPNECEDTFVDASECYHPDMEQCCRMDRCLWTIAYFAECPEDPTGSECPWSIDEDGVRYAQITLADDYSSYCFDYFQSCDEDPFCFTVKENGPCDSIDGEQDIEGRCEMPDGTCAPGFEISDTAEYGLYVCD
jgi:hypothetical protein